ncbi:DMT family transporter [Alkalicoccus chagannorensis]|uniref:DMT family transporter n=1 Tax=Alkalicoccus chagannorensis TaxID=427072 RepID=UPI00041172F3|nr:DMT family transporter [Alkalicoccus chagannorensis]
MWNQAAGYVFVIGGAACWGVTGLFVQQLYDAGFSPWQVVTVRHTVSALILLTFLLLTARHHLRIRLRDMPVLILLGVCGMALFNGFYFIVMEQASLAIAVVFVYTSPIFAALIARFVYGEQLTLQKNVAIMLTILGCAFAIGLFPAGNMTITWPIVFIGLLAGLFCSSYSLIGKFVSGRYHPLTITSYALAGGALVSFPTSGVWEHTGTLTDGSLLLPITGITLISTLAAYILFTMGLKYIESSRAAILSSTELVISVMLSVFVLQDVLTWWQAFGIALVMLSIALTVLSFRRIIRRKYPDQEYENYNWEQPPQQAGTDR